MRRKGKLLNVEGKAERRKQLDKASYLGCVLHYAQALSRLLKGGTLNSCSRFFACFLFAAPCYRRNRLAGRKRYYSQQLISFVLLFGEGVYSICDNLCLATSPCDAFSWQDAKKTHTQHRMSHANKRANFKCLICNANNEKRLTLQAKTKKCQGSKNQESKFKKNRHICKANTIINQAFVLQKSLTLWTATIYI